MSGISEATPIILTEAERAELEGLARSTNTGAMIFHVVIGTVVAALSAVRVWLAYDRGRSTSEH